MKKENIKKEFIVYDFDKTIYAGETGTDFFRYYLKKYPLKGTLFLIVYLRVIILYLFKFINLKELKERFFVFLEKHNSLEIEKLVEDFWEENSRKIYEWQEGELAKNKENCDMVIVSSASPTFIIEKFLREKDYDVVFGTDFEFHSNKFTAKIVGENNKGQEKVNKLNSWAEKRGMKYEVLRFYSDSLADKPLYDIAKEKVWVKKGELRTGMPDKKTFIDKLFWK